MASRKKTRRSSASGRTRKSSTRSTASKKTRKKTSRSRRYGDTAQNKVESSMRELKRGTLRSGRSKKKVKSRKQAIAIGLSEARERGAKVPARKASKRKTSKRKTSKRKSSKR
jgi:hypothetical protein